jgi:hypothetical protein
LRNEKFRKRFSSPTKRPDVLWGTIQSYIGTGALLWGEGAK